MSGLVILVATTFVLAPVFHRASIAFMWRTAGSAGTEYGPARLPSRHMHAVSLGEGRCAAAFTEAYGVHVT